MLIAPDCFGDSLTAIEAAEAIAAGWTAARPADSLHLVPQSDGGPGFVEVIAAADTAMRRHITRVSGPLDHDVDALWVSDPRSETAYIECAQACGLQLLGGAPTPRTALAAHSRGVGQLIDGAVQRGARRIVVGLGGSCCTDGGLGMVAALGGLARARARLAGVEIIAATDVDNPLLGARGAARVFGPQKGADAQTVDILEARLAAWAGELEADGSQISTRPGAGAAGGLGAALLALGGRRESGAAIVARHTGVADALAAADLVITGEGRLDEQTLGGKVVGALAAQAAGIPVLVLAGQITLGADAARAAGITAAYSLTDHCGSVQRAIAEARAQLEGLARRTAAALPRE